MTANIVPIIKNAQTSPMTGPGHRPRRKLDAANKRPKQARSTQDPDQHNDRSRTMAIDADACPDEDAENYNTPSKGHTRNPCFPSGCIAGSIILAGPTES